LNLERMLIPAACLALASCAMKDTGSEAPTPMPKEAPAAASAPGPGPAPAAVQCLAGPGIARTCSALTPNMTICPVLVYEQPSGPPKVSPYTLMVPKPAAPGASAPRIFIVWHLVGGGKFRDRNDGPDLQSNAEFADGIPSDSDGTNPAPGDSKHFRYRFVNTVVKEHKYTLKYLDGNGNVMSCDPKINNTGG
jgi:hypothetical protein